MYYTYYTVRPGDTLHTIAQRYRTTVDELVRDNGIRNPDVIYPGQRLRIRTAVPIRYVVRRGDTLAAIADRFDTTVEELARINGLANPDRLCPGQVLFLR